MKKILLLLCVVLLISCAPCQTAFALNPTVTASALEEKDLVTPVDRECYFFSDKDLSTALFAVPYTYCVEVIRDDGEWLYASYAADEGDYKKMYGYCRSEQFERVPSPPQNEYLNKVITITFTAAGNTFNPPPDLQVEGVYYGGYRHGADFYAYVLCRGDFCYIAGDYDDYPLNEYEQPTSQPTDAKADGFADGTGKTGLIIFIVILAVALVAVGALAFTNKRKLN